MQHNVYLEWSLNGRAYFQAFRALCRMRIFFANEQLNCLKFGDYQVEDDSKLEHDIAFWSKVKEYWEKKLEESFTREKEYFGE